MDVDATSQRLQTSNILDSAVGNNYGKLQFAINNF